MKRVLFFLQNLLLYVATIVALELAKEVTDGFFCCNLKYFCTEYVTRVGDSCVDHVNVDRISYDIKYLYV